MPSQYRLSLMEFLVNSLAYFSLNSENHNKITRNMKCLHVLQVNLSLYHKRCLLYMSIEVLNISPNCIADLVQNQNKFIVKLQSVLMEQSFYPVIIFLHSCGIL